MIEILITVFLSFVLVFCFGYVVGVFRSEDRATRAPIREEVDGND